MMVGAGWGAGEHSNPEASVALRDPRGSAVHGRTVSYPYPIPKCALAPGPWVEVKQRKERFRQEGGETRGKTSVARGDSRLPSPVQHSFPLNTVKQSSM